MTHSKPILNARPQELPNDAIGLPAAERYSENLNPFYNKDSQPSEGQVLKNIQGNVQVIGESGLKMPLPTNIIFNQVKLGKGIEASYGYDENSNVGMTMVSHKTPMAADEVLTTIKANANTVGIPNVTGVDFSSFGQAQKIKAISGSGLGDAALWRGKNSQGEEVYIGYAPRLDKQGVYIVIMSGPNNYFEDNEGYLDNLYSNMQVAPSPR